LWFEKSVVRAIYISLSDYTAIVELEVQGSKVYFTAKNKNTKYPKNTKQIPFFEKNFFWTPKNYQITISTPLKKTMIIRSTPM